MKAKLEYREQSNHICFCTRMTDSSSGWNGKAAGTWIPPCHLDCGQLRRSLRPWYFGKWATMESSLPYTTWITTARQSGEVALSLRDRLGVPVLPKKIKGRATSLPFLGILLDTGALAPAGHPCLQAVTKEWERKEVVLQKGATVSDWSVATCMQGGASW